MRRIDPTLAEFPHPELVTHELARRRAPTCVCERRLSSGAGLQMMADGPRTKPAGDYSEVLPFLGAPDNEARLERLEQCLRAEDAELFEPAEHALRKLHGQPVCKQHATCWALIARSHWFDGRFEAAKGCSDVGLRIALAVGDSGLLAKTYKLHGMFLHATGKVTEAIPATLQGLQIAQSEGLNRQPAELLNNLGLMLFDAGRLAAAHECLKRSVRDSSLPEPRANIAQLLIELGDSGGAISTAWEAFDLIPSPKTIDEYLCRVHVEVTLTLALVSVGDVAQATDHAIAAHAFALRVGETGKRLARLSLLLIDAHDASKAIETRKALMSALGETSFELHRISRTIAIAALQAMGHADEAAEVLRQVIKRDAINRTALIQGEPWKGALNDFDPALDDQAADLLRQRQSRLFTQAARLSATEHQRIEYLVRLAIRTELREEDSFASGEHVYRVSRLAELLAMNAGCSTDELRVIQLTGLLHDLGKVCIPDQILLKPGPLTNAELAILRRHSKDGAELIDNLKDPSLNGIADAVAHTHERWDGGGYPIGLSGEQIPLAARVVAIAESFDVTTHRRLRSEARSFESALAEIQQCAGTQFDPRLCSVFIPLMRRLHAETENLDRFLAEAAEDCSVVHEQRLLLRLLRPDSEWLARGNSTRVLS